MAFNEILQFQKKKVNKMTVKRLSSKIKLPFLLMSVCTLLWLVGFTYPTGFGQSYEIFEKTELVLILVTVFCLTLRRNIYEFKLKNILLVCIVIFISVFNYAQNDNSIVDYLCVWLIIPVIKLFTLKKNDYKLICYIFGIASTGVLLIGNMTNIFENWDGNSVSLVQFFSYAVFISAFSEIKKAKNMVYLILFSAIYFYLLATFESRSAIWFSALMLLCMLRIIPFRKLLNKTTLFIILLIPLIIALFVTAINDLPFIENLNSWSLRQFDKTIFSERDLIWEDGIKIWLINPIIGNGNLSHFNYHNSAITALVGVGVIGYAILIGVLYAMLKKALKWKHDSVVYGLTTSFLIIWAQQSVELGLIAKQPNVIPYLILGLICARIRTLEEKNAKFINNRSHL